VPRFDGTEDSEFDHGSGTVAARKPIGSRGADDAHMNQRTHITAGVATLAAAILCPAAVADAKRADAVRCGQVIKRDTTLRADLVNCPGSGLIIGADGVTLDLGGHRIDGTNADGGEGIAVDGHAGVTIRNGRVRQFRFNGVAIRKSRHARVAHLNVEAIGAGGKENEPVSAGIFVQRSNDAALDGNRVSNAVKAYQADGIVVLQSKRLRVVGNRSSANAWNGIVVIDSPNARIADNRTERNTNSGILVANATGVTIDGNRSNNQEHPDTGGIVVLATKDAAVTGNRTNGNNIGISLESGVTSAKVARNTVSGGGDGIALLESDGNTVERNQAKSVGGVGIVLDVFGPPDASPNGSDDNTIDRNEVKSSGLAGILVVGGSDGNRITRNVSNGSRGNGQNGDPDGGILIDGATANRLDGNTASGNSTDGVRITTAGNTVAGTTALDNLRRGIEAVDGTIDGGGNHATGNGLEPQCTGVACA
jgi:parallel beta-helix repeat protein